MADRFPERHITGCATEDVKTGEITTLVKGRKISRFFLSPDGSRIVYTEPLGFEHPGSQQTLYDLVVFDRRDRGRVTLAPRIRLDYDGAGFSWSRDGTQVSFFGGGAGAARAGLYGIAVDHPEPLVTRLLYDDPQPIAHRMPPVWDEAGDILTIKGGVLWRTQNGRSASALAQIEGWTIRQVVQQSPNPIGQRRDARRVVVVAANGDSKAQGIFSIDLDTGRTKELLGGMECIACGSQYLLAGLASRGSEVAFLREDSAHPSDLWVLDSAIGTSVQLTRLNPQLDRYEMGSTRLIDWLGLDGQYLQGALLLPADYQTGRRYPLVTVVYAGAHPSYFLNRFGTTGRGPLNPQLLATRGYAVLFPDSPQGVGSPVMDLLKTVLPGINKVIAMGIADQDRLGVMGHSNGGYSTVALITQTHRFKAAVEIAGLADLIGAYGEMDKAGKSYATGLFEHGQDALGGTPWEEWDKYVENSPLYYLDHVSTPLLMAHGERDIYVAPFLADELFVGLRRGLGG
jgi:dipeptidyl aminopeptidase/acylaminoacyl peptidase